MYIRKNKIYERFSGRNMNMNDQLAAVRSILANERTFLSYQRSAITIVVSAFSFIRFFDNFWIVLTGWLLLPAAAITFAIGMYRYIKMRALIMKMGIRTTAASEKLSDKLIETQ